MLKFIHRNETHHLYWPDRGVKLLNQLVVRSLRLEAPEPEPGIPQIMNAFGVDDGFLKTGVNSNFWDDGTAFGLAKESECGGQRRG